MILTDRRQWLRGVLGATTATLSAADIHEHIQELADAAPLDMQFHGSTAEDCLAWQKRFGDKLAELLGPHRPPPQWDVTLESSIDFDDHQRQALLLSAAGHPDLPLYLLTPRGPTRRTGAGIVALHGHGPFGHDAVAGVDDTPERAQDIEDHNYDFGRQLARKGYTVVVPCFAPFGRRLDSEEAYRGNDACAVAFVRLQLLGKNLMSENLRDALWAFEFLARRPEVDSDRIGCVGLSYGGRMTMLAAAVEPRIRVAVVSGALNMMQERIGGRYSCGAQVIPGLLEHGDVPEIGGLIAPRPAVWEVGRRDGLMVKDWIPDAWKRLQRPYQALGSEDHLQMDSFDGTHRWNGSLGERVMAETLKT